jgi:hypothetical protein
MNLNLTVAVIPSESLAPSYRNSTTIGLSPTITIPHHSMVIDNIAGICTSEDAGIDDIAIIIFYDRHKFGYGGFWL